MIRGRRSGGWALVLLALALTACGGGGTASDDAKGTTTPAAVVSSSSTPEPAMKPGKLAGPLVVSPVVAAPEIALRDQDGKPFKLSSLRGKVVYITFVYSHCPDVCPLMLQALAAAKRDLADPSSMQIIAVSVDPKGDTPKAVKSFLRRRLLTGKVRWLLGTRAELTPVWTDYNILVDSLPKTPAIIEHASLIYGLDPRGRIRVGYPASPLKSTWIEHDVPILARAK